MNRLAFGAIVSALLSAGPAAAESRCPDLSLVLAVDSSSSIDESEFRLQVMGYAAAFADPKVLRALQDAGTVEVGAVFWADSAMPPHVVPWRRIDSAQDAARLAAELMSVKRGAFGDTDIGDGLMAALDMLAAPGQCATRAVVNVSGDGRASAWSRRSRGISLDAARERAEAMGVTVNGLAILNAEPSLAEYYRTRLITGPGSFVIEADDFSAFGAAIVKKLEREIQPQLSAEAEPEMTGAQPRLWK